MKKKLFLTLAVVFSLQSVFACTNFLVTKGASRDGSVMISYAADSHVLYGELYHWPAASYPEGTMLDVYEWDTGEYLGQIEQARETYNVVGLMNEHQVSIGETTYGGRPELGTGKQTGAVIDYGSLMFITLQRSKSAREAIKIMTGLVEKYGYYSSGESFSIADEDEVWILEMIGKGDGKKGAVWVALQVPDGYVCAHANQARITTFPLADGETSITSENIDDIFNPEVTCVYEKETIDFAREMGWYEGKDENFSFSDTYAPVSFGGARFCEIRVWSFFRSIKSGMDKHFGYASGRDIKHDKKFADGTKNPNKYATNRMPLWIKPDEKIDVHQVMNGMRDHLEGTELDMRMDLGAGPFQNPYRWRPLTWEVDGVTYCNERATATQQTGFSFVGQMRNWLPDPVGGVFWFGVDDAASCVYMPMYCSMTETPEKMAKGYGSLMEFKDDAAFWVFNQVSNFAYTRYNIIHPEIEKVQQEMEEGFIEQVTVMDELATVLYEKSPEMAAAFLTDYSTDLGNETVLQWRDFYHYLFTKYMDGNVKEPNPGKQNPKLEQPGYGEDWYKRIVDDTGDQFKVIGDSH